MVYLVWERYLSASTQGGRGAKLIGVWREQIEAGAHARKRAGELANGSGRVSESLYGETWIAKNAEGEEWAITVDEIPYGPVS